MPFHDQDFREQIVSSLATIQENQKNMKEQVTSGFHYFKEQGEKFDAALLAKAEEKDLKELEEKHHDLDKTVTRQSGIAIGASGLLSMAIAGLTAWWTRH